MSGASTGVEVAVDAGHDAIVKAAHERRVDRGYALSRARRSRPAGRKRADARLPLIVLERPAKSLHADNRHSRDNSWIDSRRQIRLGAALRDSHDADALGSTSGTRLEIVDEPHHIPDGVVQIRAALAGAIRFEHRRVVLLVVRADPPAMRSP